MTRTGSTTLIALLATAGCATAPQEAKWVDVRPLQVGGERQMADRYYPGAVAAIERRDYAAALELLQLARAQAPADVRVFNAFGVIYDKLGRFDLSARYYAQAAALEPSSPIVAANVAYSAVLESRLERPVEAVQLARAEGDMRRMPQPDLTPDLAPIVHRIVEGVSSLTLASAPPVRIEATRARFASASPQAMKAAAFSDTAPAALAPVVSAAPRLITADNAPTRIDAARPRLASASPRPMAQPTISETVQPVFAPVVYSAGRLVTADSAPVRIDAARPRLASASPRPMAQPNLAESAPPVLARVVSSAPQLVAANGAPVRVEAAKVRVAAASPRPMSQPSFAAAGEPSPAVGPPVRLPLVTASAPTATPRHLLYPVVKAAEPPMVAFAAAAEPAPSAGPPVRLPLVSLAAASPRAQPARAAVVRLAAAPKASPAVVKLAANAAPRRLPLLTGNTLLVINASGRKAGGEPVTTRLAHLGWSMPRSARIAPAQARTSIVFPARNAAVAQALAKTLPYRVRLVNCGSSCRRMSLVLGADALAWRKGARTGSIVKAKIA